MVAGRRVVLRRAKMDDDEYVADEDEEEEEEEDEVEPEPEDESDAEGEEGAEEEEDEDLEIDPPRRPSRPRGRGRKARSDDGDDDSDADFDGGEEESEDEEDLEVDTPRPRPRPRRPAKARRRGGPKRKREPDEDSDADFEEELEVDTPRPRSRRRARKAKPRDDSDADSDGEEGFEIETPTPKRAPRARRRARKPKPQDESDRNFGEEEDDGLEDEGFEMEVPRPKRAPTSRFRARKAKPHDESEADSDGEEDDGLENEEWEVEAPWPKRPPTVRSRRRREEQEIVQSDADFRGEEEEQENEELEVEMPQPASPGISMKQEDQFDADFNGAEEEVEDQEEDEEMEIEMPQSVMYRSGGRNPKQEDDFYADFNGVDEEVKDQEEDADLETETPPSVKYHSDDMNLKHGDDFDADFNGAEEEFEEGEELETEMLQPTNPSEARGKGRKVKPAGSSRQRHEDDDDYEEEVEDEDEDFEPEVDEEEEDEEEDVEEEDDDLGDYGPTRATKLGPRNHLAKRKPAARRQHRKRKSGSRVSKGKTRNGMSARRRRRKGWVADDHEDDEEEDEDEDFVVSDNVDEEVNCRPRKKAKGGRDGTAEPVPAGEAWPSVESDTSEFEFVTSEEEHAENEAPVAEPAKIKRKKGRRKKGSESDSSSDSDYVISEEELKDLGFPQETVPQLPLHPARRTIVPNSVDGKGKEPEEALKQICGICLSEEQTSTIQGVLNCCTHYFCFVCILEWSKVESRCPLCKRRFNTITKSSVADLGLGLRNAPVRVEKRNQVYQPTEDEMRRWLDPYENVVCIECNQGGDDNLMLLCDICDSSAHTFCVGLGREVPEGNWYCGGCRSSVEGPSNAQTQERVVHRAESNINTADSSSGSFGRSIPTGVFQRPPPINVQPSLQGFDLNLSPIETPEEDKRAESHIAAEPVSTPTGRHATLDRRRALNRRIRILLFRPRTATNAWQNSVQHDRSTAVGTEQNQRNTSTSTDLSPSCSRPDFMQSQQSSSHLVQSASNLTQCTDEGGSNFREVENAKDELIPIVKKSIKHICARSPLDQSSFTNVARRATHTILALSGIAHNRDRVVATPFPFPSHCCHACDGREPAFLMRTICSSCFNLFVDDVVSHIANMFS